MSNIREEVNHLLKEGRYQELVAKALESPGILRYLFRLLYHPYGLTRWRAIEGLGCITQALQQQNPEAVREVIRRLLWSMNDESGTTGWSSPEAIGEIIRRNPEEYREFISIVVNASEEEIFHRGIAWTLGRVGSLRPDLVQEFIPLLKDFLLHPRPEVRGYAARSLGQIGPTAKEALPTLQGLLKDHREIEVYQGNELANVKLGDLAQVAIHSISGESYKPT
ncbi:DVU0298 family protein [Desulfotomaculum sp. 1211_IL3151]|uniref:DVU0298 family protein n=1 Tax=Desulfotomaculum sp. 1211_IL3151 TaxID=3084055 RepID=UPI002FDA123B